MKRIITSILMILLLMSSALAVYAEQSEPVYEGGSAPTATSTDPPIYIGPDDTVTADGQWDIKGELKEEEMQVFEHNDKKYEVMLEDFTQEENAVILKWNVNGNKLNMKIQQEPDGNYPPAYKLPATASNSYFTVQVVNMELSAQNDYAKYYQRPQVAFHMKFKETLPPVPGDYFQDTFEVGQTKQYEWKNKEYEITLLAVDNNNIDPYEDTDNEYATGIAYKMPTAKFMVNGIVTKWLYDGQKQELITEDGRNIGTFKVLDVGVNQAEFQFHPRLTPEPANNWISTGETKVFDQYAIEYEVTLEAIEDNVALLTINGGKGKAADDKRTTIGEAAVTVDVKDNGVFVTYIGAAPTIAPAGQKFDDWLFEGQTKWYETKRERFEVETLEIDGNEVVLRVNNDKLAIAEGDFQRTPEFGIKIQEIIDNNNPSQTKTVTSDGNQVSYARARVHFTLYVYGQATTPPVYPATSTEGEAYTNIPSPEENEQECTEANPCVAPNPYGGEDQGYDVQEQDVSCATGCTHDSACLPVGTRVANGKALYCEYTKQMQEQKTNEQTCQNNYECESNQCLSGTCQSLDKEIQKTQGMLEKLFDWLGNIF